MSGVIPHQERDRHTVCVLGATGYVGGRLVPRLLERGWRVRAVGRSAFKLRCRPFALHERCEIFEADLFDLASLRGALEGCYAAYYLVHSMQPGSADFAAKDRRAAQNMARAAHEAGLVRMVYLGGLIPDDPHISHHLRSRAEVGEILSGGQVPCTIFRAGIILGSGSASFEILRYLVDRLPVMVTPKWVRTETQPISIRDVLFYLAGCLEHPETTGDAYDIGGPCVETYKQMFRIYQEEAGLRKRLIIPVPFLSLRVSSYWLGLVSPVPTALARPLVMGLRNRAVCKEHRIRDIMPCELADCRATIRRALEKVRQQIVDTCWSDAGAINTPEWVNCGDAGYVGGTVFHITYQLRLKGCLDELWQRISGIGGDAGWYCCNTLWSLRGRLDRLVGGVGLRRGRRHPTQVMVGDALDFWRVLDVKPQERLLLVAEMKLPGDALLEFTTERIATGDTEFTVTARFLPRGLGGLLYWRAFHPLHNFIFKGMARALAVNTSCEILKGPTPIKGVTPSCRLPAS